MRLELKLKKSLFVLAIVSAAMSANAATIFTTGADWKYIDATAATTFAGDTTGWTGVSYDDSSWYTGATLFGNMDYGLGAPATEWTAGYDAKVRKTIDAGAGIDGAVLNIAIDNGYTLFLDGVQIDSQYAEGYTNRWEYSVALGDLSAGVHTLALQLDDNGGVTAFDAELTGTEAVPEPATMAALGMGALALLRRRRSSK
jgi:hypothetical protein